MTDFFIVVAMALLVYLVISVEEIKKRIEGPSRKKPSLREMLPGLKGKKCEFTVSKPLAALDDLYQDQVKGQILDFDDEWVLISCPKRNRQIKKLLRISVIADIKEISVLHTK